DAAGAVGEPLGHEVVLREAALADALLRELEPAARPAALDRERHVLVALAEVDRGREARVARRLELARIEVARAQEAVVRAHRAAAREVPCHAAARTALLDMRRGAQRERLGAPAVGAHHPPLA